MAVLSFVPAIPKPFKSHNSVNGWKRRVRQVVAAGAQERRHTLLLLPETAVGFVDLTYKASIKRQNYSLFQPQLILGQLFGINMGPFFTRVGEWREVNYGVNNAGCKTPFFVIVSLPSNIYNVTNLSFLNFQILSDPPS